MDRFNPGWLMAVGSIFWVTTDKDMRRLVLNLPTNTDVLFWSIPQRDAAFRAFDRMTIFVKSRIIPAGKKIHPLPKGAQLDVGIPAPMGSGSYGAMAFV
jgi:hypothetical protein